MKPAKAILCISLLILIAGLSIILPVINSNVLPRNTVNSSRIGKIKKVLVLSNSILKSEPSPELGWYGNWGMAASAMDSDFYHLLVRDIHAIDPSVVMQCKNIGGFERRFATYPFSNLDSFRDADMIIIRISENVNEHEALAHHFITYYDSLLNYLDPERKAVRVIVDGFWRKGFRWPQPWKRGDVNVMIRNYALQHHYPLISITHLFNDPSNTAKASFKYYGVSIHPSNKGMRLIEEAIWAYVRNYFPPIDYR